MASQDNVAANRLSIHVARPNRVSMEEYYHQRSSIEQKSSFDIDPPPSYDALLFPTKLRRKFNIQPREDEGRETLPAYSSSISLASIFGKKMELEETIHQAQDRSWNRVLVELQGTALYFYEFKPGAFARVKDGRIPTGTKRGKLLKAYNLQHADVGIAADYLKKRHVIRVRAEADQFLLSCGKMETFVLWLQSLFAAIDLALPLDDREIPRDYSIPRPRRLFRMRTTTREGSQIIQQQDVIIPEFIPEELPTPDFPPTIPTSATTLSSNIALASNARELSFLRNMYRASPISSTNPHPSVSPETGKWRPHHAWTAMYDMLYAKRCMAVLTCSAPRKTNYVIMMGKQWVVDWATGKLTRCAPPDYGEVVAD